MPTLPHSTRGAACLGLYGIGTGPFRMKSEAIGIDHERDLSKTGCSTFCECLEASGRAKVPGESFWRPRACTALGWKEGLGDLS